MAKQRNRPRGSTSKRLHTSADSGCQFVVEWKLLKSITGMTPIWVPDRTYKKIAASFLKKAKGQYIRHLLRARMAPIGVWHVCSGSCYGGWCKERVLQPDGLSAVSVCECQYYV
jgi:hypothetical protein